MSDTSIIEFNPKSHRYKRTDTGTYIPSVTTVLGLLNKPMLVYWAANCAGAAIVSRMEEWVEGFDSVPFEEIEEAILGVAKSAHRTVSDDAKEVGNLLHASVAHTLLGGDMSEHYGLDNIEASMAYDAFLEWMDTTMIERIVGIEKMLVMPNYSYVGTVDLIAVDEDGKAWIYDFKTTSRSDSNPLACYPEYLFQVAAYWRMAQHANADLSWGGAAVISCGKDGQYAETILPVELLDEYADAFELMVKFYPHMRASEKFLRDANKIEKQRIAALVEEEV